MDFASCPWAHFAPSTLQWCEAATCTWIREPGNTWSNIGFLIAGAMILAKTRRLQHTSKAHLNLIGVAAILTGLTSTIYHASQSFMGEAMDFSSMFLIASYLFIGNLSRALKLSSKATTLIYLVVLGSSIGLLLNYRQAGIEIFALQVVGMFVIEFTLWLRSRKSKPANYKYFRYYVLCFAVAYLFWWLDKLKILCAPDNHWLTGHGVWHLLNAGAFWYVYRFYSQFKLGEYPTETI